MSGFRVLGISWAGVGTDRYEENLALFRDLLSLEVEHEAEDQAILRAGTQQLGIFGRDGPGKLRNTPPTSAFEVDDFDAAHAALREAGVEIDGEPGEWNGHRWLYFRNADGYLFAIKVSPQR